MIAFNYIKLINKYSVLNSDNFKKTINLNMNEDWTTGCFFFFSSRLDKDKLLPLTPTVRILIMSIVFMTMDAFADRRLATLALDATSTRYMLTSFLTNH